MVVAPFPPKVPRKHSELIKKWADGAEIQINHEGNWLNVSFPVWNDDYNYRLKPEEPPLVERECKIVLSHSAGVFLYAAAPDEANCVFVFRGDKLVTSFVKQPTK